MFSRSRGHRKKVLWSASYMTSDMIRFICVCYSTIWVVLQRSSVTSVPPTFAILQYEIWRLRHHQAVIAVRRPKYEAAASAVLALRGQLPVEPIGISEVHVLEVVDYNPGCGQVREIWLYELQIFCIVWYQARVHRYVHVCLTTPN